MLLILLFVVCCIQSVQGGDIGNCRDGVLLARENEPLRTECYHPLVRTGNKLIWKIRPWRHQPSLEIVCTSNETGYPHCSSHPEVDARWFSYGLSKITINSVEQGMFNSSTIACNSTVERYNHSLETSCKIDAVYDAEVRSCDLEVNKPTWTVNGSCDVTKVYSSAGRYGYVLYQTHTHNTTKSHRTITGSVNVTDSLTSFSETSSGNVYYRGRVPFTVPLPSEVGEVTYSVKVTPGTVTKNVSNVLKIKPPSQPEHTNCNQRTFLEGGKAPASPCECWVTSLGSPSGRLQWMADDVILVSGEYGVTRLLFPYDKVTRAHDGRDMLCRVDWVVKKSGDDFTAEIIYGPNGADIFVHELTDRNDDANMTLICDPDDVKAGSSVVTVWGGLCQGQQGRRCTLTPPMAEHYGKEVTCTATNQKCPEKKVTGTWIVQSADCKAEMINCKDSLAEGVGTGVGVTLVVVMAVVVVMLLVLWKRRFLPALQCCVPTYDIPSKKRQREEEEQRNYTDLSNYEIVEGPSGSSSAARVKSDGKTRKVKENEDLYVNIEAL